MAKDNKGPLVRLAEIRRYWWRVWVRSWHWTWSHPWIAYGAIVIPAAITLASLPLYSLFVEGREAKAEIGPTLLALGVGIALWILLFVAGMIRSAPSIDKEAVLRLETAEQQITEKNRRPDPHAEVRKRLDRLEHLRTERMSDDEFIAAYEGRKEDLRVAIHGSYPPGRLTELDTFCHRIEATTIKGMADGDTCQSVHEAAIAELVPAVKRIIKEEESSD